MRRILLGIIALGSLTAGLVMLPIWNPAQQENYLGYLLIKVGLVLGAIWLAMPQVEDLLKKTPPWLWAVIGLSLLAAVFTKSFIIILPIVAVICFLQFVGWLFKPPTGSKRSQQTSRRPNGNKS